MLTYIVRRVLLMIPTLFGITVMVFLIARFAPGSPGSSAFGEGGNQMNAEGRKKLLEEKEKRFGLNLPLPLQYVRWWKGMFFDDRQAQAWTEDFRPIYTLRNPPTEYYTTDPATGNWYTVESEALASSNPEVDQSWKVYRADDKAFLSQLSRSEQTTVRDAIDPDYPMPEHAIVSGKIISIEPLSLKEVKPATRQEPIQVQALVWRSFDGAPIYVDPDHPRQLILQSGGDWYQFTPDRQDESRWDIFAQDDPSFRPRIPSRYFRNLTQVVKGRPIPRHALISGEVKKLDREYDPDQLTQKTIPTRAFIDARLWINEHTALWPVYVADFGDGLSEHKVFIKLYKNDKGNWERLIGANRLVEPAFTRYTDFAAFEKLVPADRRSEIIRPRQLKTPIEEVVFRGKSIPYEQPVTDREVMRYSHALSVFCVTLGRSQTSHTTVMEELRQRLPISLGINLLAFPIIYIIAIPTGILMALKRGKYMDATSNVVLLALWSVPSVLAGTLLIGYAAKGGNGVHWFPPGGLSANNHDALSFMGQIGDYAQHLALPVLCIVYGSLAYLAKQMRGSMLENFTMDYVRTAKAKGVSQWKIVMKHVLRNSLIPIITIVATILPVLIAGSVIIEKIFNIEGMGLFAFRAIQNRDYDVVQSMALIAGALNLSGLLIADICYAIVDPRIAYD